MRLEHHLEPLLPRRDFLRRQLRYTGVAVGLLVVSLGIGVLGYHGFEGLPWLDALLNASMILGGMGPVDPLRTSGGKVFASLYALFSGVVFLVSVGVLLTPLVHRILHRFHLEAQDGPSGDGAG